MHVDGVDDSVFIARSATLEPEAVTVEGWVRGSTSPGTFKHIISQGAYQCEVASYGLYTGPGGGLAFYLSNGSDDQLAISPLAPATIWNGAWHHVAGTYDGTTVRLFVDGVEVGAGAAATIPIGYGLPNPAGQLGAFGGGCMLNWGGDLDEPRIWRRALSAPELAASAAMGAASTTTLDEKVDSSEAIAYTSAFSSPSNIKISIESATGTERISSVRLQGVLPGLLGMARAATTCSACCSRNATSSSPTTARRPPSRCASSTCSRAGWCSGSGCRAVARSTSTSTPRRPWGSGNIPPASPLDTRAGAVEVRVRRLYA